MSKASNRRWILSTLDLETTPDQSILELSGGESIDNKSTDISEDAESDTKYPSCKSVVTYVTDAVSGDIDLTNVTIDGGGDV